MELNVVVEEGAGLDDELPGLRFRVAKGLSASKRCGFTPAIARLLVCRGESDCRVLAQDWSFLSSSFSCFKDKQDKAVP